MSVEANVHLRAAIFVITGLRIGHLITGDDQGTLELHGRATFLAELEGFGRGARRIGLGRKAELQICRLAENALGFGSVLYARQFDHDAVGPLALHQRLGDAQLVDAVAHGGQVLLDRIFANLSQLGLGQRQPQHELAVALAGGQLEIGEVLANQRLSGAEGFLIGEAQLHGILQIRQAAIAHALLAQQAFDLAFGDVQPRLDGLLHIDFQQEVHAAGEVETELHGAGPETAQPVWSGRCKVERNDIGITQRAPNDIFGRQLILLTLQTHETTTALFVERRRLDGDTAIFERLADAFEICRTDLLRRAGASDLDRRVVRIEVGCRVNEGNREHCQNQQVFPERESIEHDAARLMNAGRLARPVGVE